MTLLTGTIESFTQTKTEPLLVVNKRDKPLDDKNKLVNHFKQFQLIDGRTNIKTELFGYILDNGIFLVYNQPTANCQTVSVSGFQQIFAFPDQVNSILLNIYQASLKRLIIIEIRQDYMSYFDEMIDKDMIMFKQLYDSTNGSKMALIMLNISKLVPPTT